MGVAVLGTLGVVLENTTNRGEQTLLNAATVSATMSLTTQPTGSTGMRLRVVVTQNTATGSIVIAGKDVNGNAISETVPPAGTIPLFPADSTAFEYCTVSVFSSVNASGITVTGLTGGLLTITGIQASKILLPTMFAQESKFKEYVPDEIHGTLETAYHIQQLVKEVTIDKLEQSLYPENSLFLAYLTYGAPASVVTLPSTPTVLLAATVVSGSPLSLTTQPSTPGMKLILTVASSTAVGTIAITGVDRFGNTVSETLTAALGGTNGNGAYNSGNVYSSVNASGITVTGLTTGTLAVSGVYGWEYTFNRTDPVYSAAFEWFTGTDSVALPWSIIGDFDISGGVDKEVKVSAKGMAQNELLIGDRTTTSLAANRAVALSQPLDIPMVGWQSALYIDPSNGTPFTTAYTMGTAFKITLKNNLVPHYTIKQTQLYSLVSRKKFDTDFELDALMTDVAEYEQFRKSQARLFGLVLQSDYIGGGYYKQWKFALNAKYLTAKRDQKDVVEVKFTSQGLYNSTLGYSNQLTIINQYPPILAL